MRWGLKTGRKNTESRRFPNRSVSKNDPKCSVAGKFQTHLFIFPDVNQAFLQVTTGMQNMPLELLHLLFKISLIYWHFDLMIILFKESYHCYSDPTVNFKAGWIYCVRNMYQNNVWQFFSKLAVKFSFYFTIVLRRLEIHHHVFKKKITKNIHVFWRVFF